jgi:hypothetical protein
MRKEVRRFEAALRDDFYRLHSGANDAGLCFCVAWWVPTWYGWGERSAAENRQLRESLCARGEHDGYLLYVDDMPAGWCQPGHATGLPSWHGSSISRLIRRPGRSPASRSRPLIGDKG